MPLKNKIQVIKMGFWHPPNSLTIAAKVYNKNVIITISKYCKEKYHSCSMEKGC